MNYQELIDKDNYLREYHIEKATSPELISIYDLQDLIKSGYAIETSTDEIEKAERDMSKLMKKEVWVKRGGRSFKQTVWVKIKDETEVDTPIGGELSPDVKGMKITKMSDKALLITGDTYVNVDTLRKIKKETGVGKWNRKQNGWMFPMKYLDAVLGFLWSDQKEKGNNEKASAIQNQKNAGFEEGEEANIGGEKGKVDENVSNSDGIKYNVTLKDGTKLENVDEKVLDKASEKDDKKISEIISNAQPENRVKTEKKIYGIKAVQDIHKYSLSEYMGMHGISQEDIDKAIKALKAPQGESKKRSGGGGGGSKSPSKDKIEGLTKRQLIAKLIYKHYQSTKQAIENGETVNPENLKLYSDLADLEKRSRKPMSEETKRKISEALKKNKVPENENPEIKKENVEAEKEGFKQPIDKENYQPKLDDLNIKFAKGGSKKFKVKNYTDIPVLDISTPKQKDILKKPKPYFIPDINEKEFENNGYQFSAFKLSEDKYIVALGGYHRDSDTKRRYTTSGWGDSPVNNDFAYMSLDQLAATESYYRVKAKQELKEKENKWIETTKQKWRDEGRDEEYIKSRKFSRSRIKVMSDKKSTYSNFHLQDDINYTLGEPNTNRWNRQRELRQDIKQKQIDLDLQQEYSDSAYTKGAETSYGDSGTKNTLMEDYGVKIKRQNGDEINDSETKQIKDTLDSVAKVFGNNKEMNKEFGLKISHSGDTLMHARKAVGLFHPFYNAIGVSSQHGSEGFKITFAHEYGHFMDYWLGKKTGNHYISDKQGSTANTIADTLRKNMNEAQKSAYYNRTCECFARSMEQYYAVEVLKDRSMFYDPTQVNEENYKNKLKPLIEQFLKENKDLLKSTLFDIL